MRTEPPSPAKSSVVGSASTSSSGVTRSNPSPTRFERLRAYRLLWVLALTIFVLDQATKFWINARMPLGTYGPYRSITVIDGFFYLVHVGNTGAAWSMFSGKSAWLAGLALLTLGAIYLWRHSLGLRQRIVQVSFGLLCGGIVGNLVDRLLHGHVIDFLDFHFGSYVYPTFNVADAGICIGVAIYLNHSRRSPPQAANGGSSK